MKQPLKKLKGPRLIIANFIEEKEAQESVVQLLDETKKQIEAEKAEDKIQDTQRFTILQVGEGCEDKDWEPGMEVYIENPERVLTPMNAQMIIEDEKIVGFIVPERQIAGIF